MSNKRLGGEDVKLADFITKLDESSTAGVLYVGKAVPGSLPGDATWQIKRVTDTEVSFAKGTALFDKAWNERTTYTYS